MTENNTNNEKSSAVFIRRGQNGGLYFFSPSGNFIFFGRSEDVKDVIDGKREWARFTGRKVNKK